MFSARISSIVALATTLLISSAAAAQDVAADVSADTSATTTTSTTSTTTTSNNSASASSSSSGDVRLTGQVRLDALNVIADAAGGSLSTGPNGATSIAPVTPFMTLGVRLMDTRLFIGAGLGFAGAHVSNNNNQSQGRFAIGLAPVVSYDLIVDTFGAFYAVGWINFVSVGESTTSVGNTDTDNNDDTFGIGFNAGVGIRGFLTEGLAIGTEIGWGCISNNSDGNDTFDHGVFGTLVFEASIGI